MLWLSQWRMMRRVIIHITSYCGMDLATAHLGRSSACGICGEIYGVFVCILSHSAWWSEEMMCKPRFTLEIVLCQYDRAREFTTPQQDQ